MTRRQFTLSEVAVRKGRASGRGDYAGEVERAAAAQEAAWNEKGDGAVVLPVMRCTEGVEAFMTRGSELRMEVFRVLYDEGKGVVFPEM